MIFYKNHICFLEGAYVVEIPSNADERLQIVFLGDSSLSVIVGENASLDLIESHISFNEAAAVIDSKVDIQIGKNAKMNYIKIIDINPESKFRGSEKINQNKDSYLKNHLFALNGKNNSIDLKATLNGENAEIHLYGLMIGDGERIVDVKTEITHNQSCTKSRQDFRAIADDRALCGYEGEIIVKKGTIKSEAYQLNKNILLSNKATIRSKPRLKIFADDVKCSHGATTGGIDKNALFYLKSRGINEKSARELLVDSFISEIIQKI